MTDHVTALKLARIFNDQVRSGVKIDKAEGVRSLASFGLFTPSDIAKILAVNIGYAEAYMNWSMTGWEVPRKWDVSVLDALEILAEQYAGNSVNVDLVRRVVGPHCSIKALAELTGIPIEEVRTLLL